MPGNNTVLRTLLSERYKKWLSIGTIVLGFVCIGECFILVSLSYILFRDCEHCEPKAEDQGKIKLMRVLATVLFLLGIFMICLSVRCKVRENSLAPQVVVSEIPAGDLEKSPAPVQLYNHLPRRQAFVVDACTATNSVLDVELTTTSVNDVIENSMADVWSSSETIHGPVTPPPSYEDVMRASNITEDIR